MSEAEETMAQGDLKSFLAWGSIAYGLGFVTVMLHTARLGFPVLELLSAVYVWVGAPLAVIGFFWVRIWRFFKSRASNLTREVRDSWEGLKHGVDAKDFDVISEFVGFASAVSPILKPLRPPVESLLRKAMGSKSEISRRAARTLSRFASLLRGLQALSSFLRLFNVALVLVIGSCLYVWVVYPLIPQSFGGGAPTTVRLLVNTQKIPPDIPGLPGIGAATDRKVTASTSVTDPLQLLYSTADHYYVEGPGGQRVSLSKSAVEGVIWNPKE